MFIIPGLMIWVIVCYRSDVSTTCVEDIKVYDPLLEEQEADLLWDKILLALWVLAIT